MGGMQGTPRVAAPFDSVFNYRVMRAATRLLVLTAALVGACRDRPVIVDGGNAAPRLISPLSTATVTSRQPMLSWALPSGADGAHIQICRDRACTTEIASFDASGTEAAAPDLPTGVVFWRAAARRGDDVAPTFSPPWQFTVGARSAPVNTSWGTTLDVNGDGFADTVVGAIYVGQMGRAYLYLGGAAGLSTAPAVTLTGAGGSIAQFGSSTASAGDVNGDGYADVLVGARSARFESGQMYLYLGGAEGLSGTATAIFNGPTPQGHFGGSVASAGDVNGDGYADVIVGAADLDSSAGRALVHLGGADGLSATPDVVLTGPDGPFGLFGVSVAGAGDVNGDRYADVIVGAWNVQRTYIYLGGPGGLATTAAVSLAAPDAGVGDFGFWVAGAGDINGDGYADVLVGAGAIDNVRGRAYLYLGGPAGIAAAPAATLVGPDDAGHFGASVTGAGDIDGDGYADIVVSAAWASSFVGRIYAYRGGPAGLDVSPAAMLTNPDGLSGEFGSSLAGAGDVDGDGYADVAVGAQAANDHTGRMFVYRGHADGLREPAATAVTGPDGANGYFGSALAGRAP